MLTADAGEDQGMKNTERETSGEQAVHMTSSITPRITQKSESKALIQWTDRQT